MLNDYCNIPIHHFIMAGITKEGKLVTFSGPQEAGNGKMLLDRYIDLPGYLQWYTTGSAMPSKNFPTQTFSGLLRPRAFLLM